MKREIFNFHSIKTRVTFFLLTILACVLGLLAYLANQQLRTVLENRLSDQQLSTVSVVAAQLNQELELRLNSLVMIAGEITPVLLTDKRALQTRLEQRPVFLTLFNGGTFVTNVDGTAVASFPVSVRRVGVNYIERDHIQTALKANRPAISRPVIGKKLHSPVVSMAVPIHDAHGKVIGALVGVIDLGKPNFLDKITQYKYGETGGFYIVSRYYRQVITATDKARLLENLPPPGISPSLDRFIQGNEGTEIFVNPVGVKTLATVKGVPLADWYVGAGLPVEEAFAPVRQFISKLLLGLFLSSLLTGMLIWWMMRRQLNPLLDTISQLTAMTETNEEYRNLPDNNKNELDDLNRSFNRLFKSLSLREERILTLSNMYNALSQANQAIVRSATPDVLFQQLCADVVHFGGMKMAWIGMLDGTGKRVKPVASSGAGIEYLEGIEISIDANELTGQGPTGTSMRECRPYWCQDYQHDPVTAAWHERGARYGWGSSASVPLLQEGRVVGAFTFYAEKTNAFDEPLQNLLVEMSVDISFALENYEREARRKRAEAELHKRDEMLRDSQIIAGLGSYTLDFRTGLWESSEVLDHLFGIDETYVRSVQGWENLIHPDDRMMMDSYLKNEVIASGKPFNMEYRIIRVNDGAVCWMHGLGKLELNSQGELQSMKGTVQDITGRKQTEASLSKLSLAVEQSPNSIVITDLDANIEYANAAFTQFTGYSLDEVRGKNPRIMQSGNTPKETYVDMWAHLSRGDIWQGELINCRKDGSEYIESAMISPVRHKNGQITHYLAIKENVTDKKAAAARIEKLAHFDQLTGLPNNIMLQDHFQLSLSLAQRNKEQLSVLFLDLDHFKNINDTLGHSVGDLLLMEIGKRIKEHLRAEDTVSRKGGDEFVILLPNTEAAGAALLASKLMEVVSQPVQLAQHELIITTSIGIAVYPNDGETLETLSKNADTAMYRVKQDTRNNFRFYTPEMQINSARTLALSIALRHALTRDQLELYYQPQISLQEGRVVGAEALLRWHHPELGMISPAEFIPIAEETGQIISIGEWVLRTATKQLKTWLNSGLPPIVVAVNLSAVQFRQANIIELITGIVDEAELPHQYLEVELTEAVTMHDPQAVIAVMNSLHDLGIRMSIDDFGTGYSCLSYLKQFKVYKLKIDQSFVRNLSENAEDKAIVTAIINLASSLGMHTIAEGVETASQLALLRRQGCDEVQGYYFSKPLPADKFENYLKDSLKAPPLV